MKKFLITVFVILGITSIAMAQNGNGNGNGKGNGYNGKGTPPCMSMDNCPKGWPCQMNGMMGGGIGMAPADNNKQIPQQTVKTADEAKAKVNEFIEAKGIKGYVIGDVETFQGRRGTVFVVKAVDAAGNNASFHINPWGNVMGPIFIK